MDELIRQLTEMNKHLAGIETELSGIHDNFNDVTVSIRGEGPCLRICGDIAAEVAQY